MVNHTIHASLTQMFFDDPETRPPWNFPDWKAITGVQHGLFPQDDALLPGGWTRDQAEFVRSYFDQFNKKHTEEEKAAFSSARKNSNQVPGRQIWRDFVTKGWKMWRIHTRIAAVLSSENLHPLTLALSSKHGNMDKIPRSVDYIYGAIDPVARVLFGAEALDRNGRLEMDLRRSLHGLIYRTWHNLRNQIVRSKDRLVILEKEAIEAFEGMLNVQTSLLLELTFITLALDKEQPTAVKIKAVIVKVARWKNLAQTLQAKEYLARVEEVDAELQAVMLQIAPGLPLSNPLPKPGMFGALLYDLS
jgi:TATA-binding protein-associated factor